MRVVHVSHGVQNPEQVIIAVAVLQVNSHVLHVATGQVNCSRLCCNRARVQRDIILHLHRLLFEETGLKTVQLHALLVPLEAVQALGQLRPETTLNVVVHSQVTLHDICEVSHNLVGILVEKALQLAHLLVVIEVLLILGIQFDEDILEVLERLNQLFSTTLLSQVRCLLQLAVLLAETLVELRQFDFHIVLNQLLLVSDDLENLVLKLLLTLHLQLFKFVKHRVH